MLRKCGRCEAFCGLDRQGRLRRRNRGNLGALHEICEELLSQLEQAASSPRSQLSRPAPSARAPGGGAPWAGALC